MIRPLNVITAACLFICSVQGWAQVAEPLIFPKSQNGRAACLGNGMNAGTIVNITSLGTRSNDLVGDPIVLCFGDQILINHAGDSDLDDDPDMSTGAGIGYAFYQCPPTVSGPERTNIINDMCLVDMPMAAEGIWVARGNREGDVTFHNNGNLQAQFFNGAPGVMTFAPITITNFDATPPTFDDGSCLHVSTGEAFSVLYLNQIELADFSTPDNSSLSGMLSLTGGYPEFDLSFDYGVTLVKIDDPSVVGVIDAAISHGGTTTFSVPVSGTYILTVNDPKGCSREFVVHVPSVDPVQMCLRDTAVMAENNFCMPVTVADFNNVASVSMTVSWDPAVIDFVGINNINPIFDNKLGFDDGRGDEGLLPILYFDLSSFSTIDLPDSAVMFDLCFTAIGLPGSRTQITFVDEPAPISVTNDSEELAVIVKPGSVVISNPVLPTLFYTACASPTGDVSLTMQVFGGVAPYMIDINVSATGADYDNFSLQGGTITTYSPIPPDVYDIIITDEAGAGLSISRTIDLRLVATQIDTLVIDPSCMGADDGRIEITSISGGMGPYATTWSGAGFTRYGIDTLEGLRAGNYILIVRDANGCQDTLDFDLQENGLQIVQDSKKPPECVGMATGEIAISIVGSASANFNYIWKNQTGQTIRNTQSGLTDQIRNIASGTYTVNVSDGTCQADDTIPLGVLKNMVLQVDSISLATCAGDNNAYIGISVHVFPNKQGPVFAWSTDPQTTVTTRDTFSFATDVRPGINSVTITDGLCEIDTSFIIDEPEPLNLSQQALQQFIAQPSCPNGANGRIDLGFADLVIGGTPFPSPRPAYNFKWYDLNNGNNTLIHDRGSFVRDLTAGTYGLFLEDANGCSDSTTLELVSGPTVNITQSMENICRGDSMAQLTVSGDLTGNNLVWSTGETTPTITNLKEGVYYVSVTEMMGDSTCTSVDSFVIVDPVLAVNTILPMQFRARSLCNEPDSGIIFNLMIDYPGPKDYIWHSLNDMVTTIPFISIDSSGDYPFTVVDRLTGCIIYDSVVNAQFPEMISVTIDSTHISCNGQTNGAITVTATGRSGSFNFNWENGASTSSASNLAPGVYQLTVTESTDSTCMVPLSITLREPEPLTLSVDSVMTQDIRCFGENNGQIGLIWEGGNQDAAPMIVWSSGGVSNTLVATDLPAGVYNIALTDSRGCMDSIDVTITEPPQLFATVPIPDDPVCHGFQTMVTVSNASGGTGNNYTFSVDNGPTQMINTPVPVFAGDHVVTIFDEKGCRIDTSLTIFEPRAISVDLGSDVSVALGDTVRLNPLVMAPSTIDAYIWTPDNLLSCNGCDNPLAFPVEDQVFNLTVVDVNGCEGQDQILVNVSKARLVYIPNAFTPNGDGVNDKWRVFAGPGVRKILGVQLFDRWGNHVFSNLSPEDPNRDGSTGWDGRINGGLLHSGVYIYLVEIEFIDGRIFTYRGDVTLVP